MRCSIYAMFFSLSLTVSINAPFLSKILPTYIHQGVPIVFSFSNKLYAVEKISFYIWSNRHFLCIHNFFFLIFSRT